MKFNYKLFGYGILIGSGIVYLIKNNEIALIIFCIIGIFFVIMGELKEID